MTSKIKKNNYLHKIYISIGVFSSIFFLIFYGLLSPNIKRIKELKKEILDQKIELEQKINREKNKVKINENLDKVKKEIFLLDEIFLETNKELEFITQLENIALKHKVEQNINLEFDKRSNKQGYKIIPLSVHIQGEYRNIIEYLKTLETLDYYINIKNITLNSVNTKNGKESKLTFDAETFWN